MTFYKTFSEYEQAKYPLRAEKAEKKRFNSIMSMRGTHEQVEDMPSKLDGKYHPLERASKHNNTLKTSQPVTKSNSELEDETEYLLSNPANRAHLLRALRSAQGKNNLTTIDSAVLDNENLL